jgi:hypothetical protein
VIDEYTLPGGGAVSALSVPDLGRLLYHAARLHVCVTAEDGSSVVDCDAQVIAYDGGNSVLIAVTDTGRELRLPVSVVPFPQMTGGAA